MKSKKMTANDYTWLEKRTLRSVDNLKLWADNPRIDPEEKHNTIKGYATDLIQDEGEKKSFIKLVNSIVNDGFIPADPIVIWKEDSKFFVAEGNRRILALKLLRSPEKSPKSIRSFIRTKSKNINLKSIEKVRVCLAPSFENAEWYINQRHFSNSIQRPWSRLQQQRWIAGLYDKYNKDIDKVCEITTLSASDISAVLKILKIRDLALDPIIMSKLTCEEQDAIQSHRIPMTILERFFINSVVKERWGFDFEGGDLIIKSNRKSFLNAYAHFLKLVIHRDEPDVEIKVNTRTITDQLVEILNTMPKVSFENPDSPDETSNNDENPLPATNDDLNPPTPAQPTQLMSKDPNRKRIVPDNHILNTANYKLAALFNELKRLPFNSYGNITAASLRVFLDLAVLEYINTEALEDALKIQYKNDLRNIPLKSKLEYLKKHQFHARSKEHKVIERLLNHANEHSLDTLNNYIHGSETHKVGKVFLNGFWNFLFPLFTKILDMEEK